MKEIKVYLHKQRIAAVIEALREEGQCGFADQGSGCINLAVYAVQGSLKALDIHDQRYSVDLADAVTYEYKLELACEDGDVSRLLDIIRRAASTGHPRSACVFVVDIEQSLTIA